MILNYNILRSVLSEPFYICSSEAEKLSALVAGLFTPNLEFERLSPEAIASHAYVKTASSGIGSSKVVKNIGVVEIRGVLTKYDSMCALGMSGYGSIINAYKSDSSIDAILLVIDSPGGSVAGTEELGNIIKSSPKPIIGYVSDIAGSAAYWLASCCIEIIANNTTACVGSIGVMTTMTDMRSYYAMQGIVMRDFYPPESVNKNHEGRAAQQGNDKPIIDHLSVLARKFQSIVRENRRAVTSEQLLGGTYFAGDVIGTLVDSIGNLDHALQRAAILASITITNQKSPKNMAKITKPAASYAALSAAAGVDALESADGSINLTADQAQAVESALSTSLAAVGRIPSLQSQLSTSQTAHQAITAELATANQRITELEAEIEDGPGADHATINTATDGDGAAASAKSFSAALAIAREFVTNQN